MRDGRTREQTQRGDARSFQDFRARTRAALVVVRGGAAGAEHELERERTALGRGPGVEIALEDDALSKEHAVLEFDGGGFRVRDLGSTNGLYVNGERTEGCPLAHGDRIEVGEHCLQLLLEKREAAPPVHVLPEE